MMVDGSIAFAGSFPQVDGIQHFDVPPPIRDQARFLQGPSNEREAGALNAFDNELARLVRKTHIGMVRHEDIAAHPGVPRFAR